MNLNHMPLWQLREQLTRIVTEQGDAIPTNVVAIEVSGFRTLTIKTEDAETQPCKCENSESEEVGAALRQAHDELKAAKGRIEELEKDLFDSLQKARDFERTHKDTVARFESDIRGYRSVTHKLDAQLAGLKAWIEELILENGSRVE